jgi:signal transduction histidine kinase
VTYGALSAVTVAIARSDPQFALAGGAAGGLAAQCAVGVLLIVAALAASRYGRGTGRFPTLLILAALAWPLSQWATPAAGPAFTPGLLLGVAWPPLLAAAALRGPDERRMGRAGVLVLVIAFTTSFGVLGVGASTVFDARAQGCLQCPPNHLLVAGDPAAWLHTSQIGLALSAVWTAGFAVLAVARVVHASPARRRLIAPVLGSTAAAVVLFGADAVHGADRGFLSNDPTDRTLWGGEMISLVLTAGAVAWGRVRTRRTRSQLARLVVDLGASPTPGGLRDRLAATLGDPRLELVYGADRSDGPGWIDAEGLPATPSSEPGREITPIMAGGRAVAALGHRRGLLDDPAMTDEIAVVSRLALEHERLHASRRAQLRELRTSRARIVATADAERRRLERDLHDGAQQRLVTLAIGVRLARRSYASADSALDGALAGAERELQRAVGELREIAHGLFPAALDEEGLAAAVEVLAEHEPRLLASRLPDERCAASVESAAYFLVCEALRQSSAGDIRVDATTASGRLTVNVRAASFSEIPVRVQDRIGAVGGTIVSDANVVHAEFPCAS